MRILHATAASIILACAIWLSSGTLAPYAQLTTPLVSEPCHYLLNVDHQKNVAGLRLLAGAPREEWASSPVLRRILYPIAAYPFVRIAGELAGGLLFNIVLNVAAMLVFARFIEARYGPPAAAAVLWLLATYPGITYWAGLPYSYAAIVPVSLFGAMILYRLDAAARLRDVAILGGLLGLLFLTYDLAPFFLPAAAFVLVRRGKWAWAAVTVAVSVIPVILAMALLSRAGVSLVNENTQGYLAVLRAYRHPGLRHPGFGAWLPYLLRLPLVLAANYLDSNFWFLPLLVLVAVVAARRKAAGRVEAAIFLSVLAVFLFNNAAPPYYGWQMRGTWIARLYQPVVAALLLCVARAVAAGPRRVLAAAVVVTVMANATVAFGPLLMNPVAFAIDRRFYMHAPPETFPENLAFYGRRPLGFCAAPAEAERQRRPRPIREYSAPFAYRPEP